MISIAILSLVRLIASCVQFFLFIDQVTTTIMPSYFLLQLRHYLVIHVVEWGGGELFLSFWIERFMKFMKNTVFFDRGHFMLQADYIICALHVPCFCRCLWKCPAENSPTASFPFSPSLRCPRSCRLLACAAAEPHLGLPAAEKPHRLLSASAFPATDHQGVECARGHWDLLTRRELWTPGLCAVRGQFQDLEHPE